MTQGRLGAVALVLGGAFSLNFGSAVAAGLFPMVGPIGAVTLRLAIAAVLMLVILRPRVRGYSRADWAVAVAFGVVLGSLNMTFYEALSRIPLGATVTLEVLGPLALSIITGRRADSWLWAGLALAGVALLGRGGMHDLNLPGVLFALVAGTCWAFYILLSQRAGSRFPKVDGLAFAMTFAALISLPLGIASAGSALLEPRVLGIGAAVALLSSAIPYSLELLALRTLSSTIFGVLMSLAPAVAATAGFLILDQRLNPIELVAIGLVVIASAGVVFSRSTGDGPDKGVDGRSRLDRPQDLAGIENAQAG
ncbi:EamA family transporter [Pseudonocardiaceae bacterium YIM PH 21723]|nr:EamA family transporter [Pseudonocardiaceae bacterium YIM PH 21723]